LLVFVINFICLINAQKMEHIKQVFKMWALVSELKYHYFPVLWLLGLYLQACHIVYKYP
jgi:hypothetical protein